MFLKICGSSHRNTTHDPEKQAHDPEKWARDPEKWACDPEKVTHDSSRDPIPVSAPHDQSHDQIWPHDPTRFGHAIHLLIGMWKTVGTNQWSMRSKRSQGISQEIPHNLSPMDTGTGNAFIGLRA